MGLYSLDQRVENLKDKFIEAMTSNLEEKTVEKQEYNTRSASNK